MEFNGFWLNLWRDLYRLAKLVEITDLFQFILFQFIRVRGYMVKKPQDIWETRLFLLACGRIILGLHQRLRFGCTLQEIKDTYFLYWSTVLADSWLCLSGPKWNPDTRLLEDVVWKKNNIWIYEFETLPVEWNLGDFGLVSMDFGPTVDCARPRLVLASWVFGKKCDLRRAAIPSCSGWSHQLFWLNNTLFFG